MRQSQVTGVWNMTRKCPVCGHETTNGPGGIVCRPSANEYEGEASRVAYDVEPCTSVMAR